MKIGIFVGLLIIVIAVNNVQAMKLPSEYEYGQCRTVAEDLKQEFGGETVLLYPNTYPKQVAHMINKKRIGGKVYYIDYKLERIFSNRDAVVGWFVLMGTTTGTYTSATMLEYEENNDHTDDLQKLINRETTGG
jgi:hypothetical protein